MEHLRCVVERITYTNTENGYTVLKVAAKNYNALVTVKASDRSLQSGLSRNSERIRWT